MANKKYIANSHVCLSVFMGDHSEHISFSPLTSGRSCFYTKDEKLQEALEKHSRFNSLFRLAPDQPNEEVVKKVAPVETSPIKKIKVTCLDDAKEYLVERFGISRTKLRGENSIKSTALAHNIEFEGI